MAYIDLNMVRAGAVSHPLEWQYCGFHELHHPPKRKGRLDINGLLHLFERRTLESLASTVNVWATQKVTTGELQRESIWSDAVMVGDEEFIRLQLQQNKYRYPTLKVVASEGSFILKESAAGYS